MKVVIVDHSWGQKWKWAKFKFFTFPEIWNNQEENSALFSDQHRKYHEINLNKIRISHHVTLLKSDFTQISLKIEFQLTMLINIASVDNLFIAEWCHWFESQFSNPRVCHYRVALKLKSKLNPQQQMKMRISEVKNVRAETFHGCLHSNWIFSPKIDW